ncbi:MAG: pyridoxal phosphate-dependent aminotransferase [Promethearchaeota archaeon]
MVRSPRDSQAPRSALGAVPGGQGRGHGGGRSLHRYNDPSEVQELRERLAEYAQVPAESLVLRPGSDILLKEFLYLFAPGRRVVITDPTFFLIETTARKTEAALLKVRLREPDFRLQVPPLAKELTEPSLVVVDNPNNPTGALPVDEGDVTALLESGDVIVLVDEAYFEFSRVTCAHLVREYPNLGVLRTLSKSFGLAGAGIGYLAGGEIVRERFAGLDVMLPTPCVVAALEGLKNRDYMERYISHVRGEKERVKERLAQLGVRTFPSRTNFLLLDTSIPRVAEQLAQRGVIVFDVANLLRPGMIRATIGTREENNQFLEALGDIYSR